MIPRPRIGAVAALLLALLAALAVPVGAQDAVAAARALLAAWHEDPARIDRARALLEAAAAATASWVPAGTGSTVSSASTSAATAPTPGPRGITRAGSSSPRRCRSARPAVPRR